MNAKRAGRAGEELRQSRLAAARRSPKDERAQLAGVGQFTKKLARRKQMPLTDKFLERARAHPVGQRRGLGPRFSLCVAKKIHGITLAQLARIIHTPHRDWSTGVMEWWNDGFELHYSNTPLLQHSNSFTRLAAEIFFSILL